MMVKFVRTECHTYPALSSDLLIEKESIFTFSQSDFSDLVQTKFPKVKYPGWKLNFLSSGNHLKNRFAKSENLVIKRN